jgi:hypothetical protein
MLTLPLLETGEMRTFSSATPGAVCHSWQNNSCFFFFLSWKPGWWEQEAVSMKGTD